MQHNKTKTFISDDGPIIHKKKFDSLFNISTAIITRLVVIIGASLPQHSYYYMAGRNNSSVPASAQLLLQGWS